MEYTSIWQAPIIILQCSDLVSSLACSPWGFDQWQEQWCRVADSLRRRETHVARPRRFFHCLNASFPSSVAQMRPLKQHYAFSIPHDERTCSGSSMRAPRMSRDKAALRIGSGAAGGGGNREDLVHACFKDSRCHHRLRAYP